MAQGVGNAQIVPSSQDTLGGHLFAQIDYSGPKSYVQGGDFMDPRYFGFDNLVLALFGSVDQSNTFRLEPRPIRDGLTPWQLVWVVNASGGEASAGLDLSGFTGKLSAFGF